ncbi:MAG TPA: hypothetical protein VFZ78_07860, partial [Flavisolibacter sp.]
MSHPRHRAKTDAKKNLSSLKKLPARKGAGTKKNPEEIVIDHARVGNRQQYSSLLELLKRTLTRSVTAPMPLQVKPMLATPVDEPFNDKDWQFELKLDGYRALAYINHGKVDLRSRNHLSFNKKFTDIYDALREWNISAVVDGEIVVLNEEGRPDFSAIHDWDKRKEGQPAYYVFDL